MQFVNNPLAWFWLYSISVSVSLLWWMTYGAYKAHRRYEETFALIKIWQEHFKNEVAHNWIFSDGNGA